MLTLYKYLSIDNPRSWEYRRKLIAEKELYFSDPQTFNDPLDCNVAGWEAARIYIKDCRIFSLSTEARDDNLMFAHYADEHRGFRLKFQANDKTTIGDASALAIGREVEYVDKIPEFSPMKAYEYYYYKSKSWSYKSEYRVLLTKKNIITYEVNDLVEVALGYRFNMDFLPVLQKWLQEGGHSGVELVKAQPFQFLHSISKTF